MLAYLRAIWWYISLEIGDYWQLTADLGMNLLRMTI